MAAAVLALMGQPEQARAPSGATGLQVTLGGNGGATNSSQRIKGATPTALTDPLTGDKLANPLVGDQGQDQSFDASGHDFLIGDTRGEALVRSPMVINPDFSPAMHEARCVDFDEIPHCAAVARKPGLPGVLTVERFGLAMLPLTATTVSCAMPQPAPCPVIPTATGRVRLCDLHIWPQDWP
jgi:hypothetical protein